MIPTVAETNTQLSSDMVTGTASIEMTPQMFNILSSQIYSDRVLAVIRETLCNARDAQVEKGEEVPLEIHLPSRLEPFFHIRDFGKGLSEEQVCGHYETVTQFCKDTGDKEEVNVFVPGLYLRYGLSTKSNSNEAIGGLGIGCKSPLAYSDSFLVESYQEGVCKTYSVYKDDGIPQVSKLTETLTTEPDGLKVKIAVKSGDEYDFAQKTSKFVKLFGYPFEIKGAKYGYDFESPNPNLETPLYNTYTASYSDQGNISVLMGGVVYSLSSEYKEKLKQIAKDDHLIMKFEIGDLTVAASREGLSEDPDTTDKLENRINEIVETFYEDLVKKIDDAESDYQVFKVLHKYNLVTSGRDTLSSNRFVCVKAAQDLLIRGGKTIDEFLVNHTSKHRFIRFSGQQDSETHILDISKDSSIAILDVDKRIGYLKVAKHISKNDDVNVIIPADSFEKKLLEEYFGEVEQYKVSEEYPVRFPKDQRTGMVKVASSGLLSYKQRELKEIEEGQQGWYIPFLRSTCEMKGVDKLKLPSKSMSYITRAIIEPMVAAGLLKEDEVFYSRKAGMRAISKTSLKEMTADILISLVSSKLNSKSKKEIVYELSKEKQDKFEGGMVAYWDHIKTDYPLLKQADCPSKRTKTVNLILSLPFGLSEVIIPEVNIKVKKLTLKFKQELERLEKENSLACSIYSYRTTNELVKDLTDLTDLYDLKRDRGDI